MLRFALVVSSHSTWVRLGVTVKRISRAIFRLVAGPASAACLALSLATVPPGGTARAAEILANSTDPGFVLVFVFGDLTLGDQKRLVQEMLPFDQGVVFLNSFGGNLVAGMEMGKAIRLKGFATYVPPNSVCASACALAWLGGQRRLISTSGRIGFHAAYAVDNGTPIPTSTGNAMIGAYMNQLGFPTNAVIFVTSAPPEGMLWLDTANRNASGIGFEIFDLEKSQPSPPPPAVSQPRPYSNTPQAQAPSSPTASIEAFLARYMREWSNAPTTSREFAAQVYPDRLKFYKGEETRDSIIAEQEAHIKRWPDRSYRVRPGSLRVDCDAANVVCSVHSVLEWTAKSLPRNALSTGSAAWNLQLKKAGDSWTISEETGEVLDRKLSKVAE